VLEPTRTVASADRQATTGVDCGRSFFAGVRVSVETGWTGEVRERTQRTPAASSVV
jgi:hypothetical protein